jgi:GNAT superfamily N-acetyltransferase
MPTVRVYRDHELPPVLKWQALAFMRVEWPFVFQGPGRYAANTYPPELDPVHVAASEGDALLSYAAAIQLTLTHASERYAVYGFGNMFTFPPYRREGLGRAVLDQASRFIRESGVDLGLLFCDQALAPFYAASGWVPVQAPTYVGPAGHQHRHDALTMALYVSDRGMQGRDRFDAQPLSVDEAW